MMKDIDTKRLSGFEGMELALLKYVLPFQDAGYPRCCGGRLRGGVDIRYALVNMVVVSFHTPRRFLVNSKTQVENCEEAGASQ